MASTPPCMVFSFEFSLHITVILILIQSATTYLFCFQLFALPHRWMDASSHAPHESLVTAICGYKSLLLSSTYFLSSSHTSYDIIKKLTDTS